MNEIRRTTYLMYEWINACMNECMIEMKWHEMEWHDWTNEGMNDEWTNAWINDWMN